MSSTIGKLATHAILIALSLIILLPIWIVLVSSITPPELLFRPFATLIPQGFTLDNYTWLFETTQLPRQILNSAIVTVGIVVGQVFVSIVAAFAFSYWRFPGRDILFLALIATMAIPFQAMMIPKFLMVKDLGWTNSLIGLIIPQLGTAFGLFLLRQHFLSFPRGIIEAAIIDGASSWQILWRIVARNNLAPIIALAILTAIEAWNEYFWPFLIIASPEMETVQLGIRRLLDFEGGAVWGLVMAGTSLAAIPVVLLYLVAQRRIVESFAGTGLKG